MMAELRPWCRNWGLCCRRAWKSHALCACICHADLEAIANMAWPALQGKEKVEGVGTGALAAALAYSDFDVSQLATWQAGDPVPFSFLAKTFDAIATTTKRLEIIKTLVGAFRAILATTPEDLLPIVYLCTNQVGSCAC